jgi:hypothetical protein
MARRGCSSFSDCFEVIGNLHGYAYVYHAIGIRFSVAGFQHNT